MSFIGMARFATLTKAWYNLERRSDFSVVFCYSVSTFINIQAFVYIHNIYCNMHWNSNHLLDFALNVLGSNINFSAWISVSRDSVLLEYENKRNNMLCYIKIL